MRFGPSPSELIIHAGSNDLGRYFAKDCRQAVDEALNTARSLLPQCYISFSSILLACITMVMMYTSRRRSSSMMCGKVSTSMPDGGSGVCVVDHS